ncbi:MAG: DUF255 domain-containing protein [Campylobacterota bacterium]|nr:DUF255 domain-containing protein [Campylobacterota bacterium]
MKNIFLNLLFGSMVLSLTAYGDSNSSVLEKSDTNDTLTWQEDVKTAFQLAQKEQKSVMVMVEDERCRWCIKMKEGALSDSRVQKNLQYYVLLKIDRSDNESMESLPGLRGPIPSFHFFTAQKRSIDKIAGYYETEDFLGYIKEIAEDEL